MKIYVIPDIHGMLEELKQAISLFQDDLNDADTKLVFLGDYIHGGKDSIGVVDYIMGLQEVYGTEKIIALLGNHEEFVLDGYSSLEEMVPRSPYQIEAKYIEWFKGLPRYYQESHTIFVHAGIDEDLGGYWKYTDDQTYTNKYPAATGNIEGLAYKIVAGHVHISEIAGDASFSDIYYDGFNHYYLDGDGLKTGKLNVMLIITGEQEDKYFEVTKEGTFIISEYY